MTGKRYVAVVEEVVCLSISRTEKGLALNLEAHRCRISVAISISGTCF